jgi:hypothetical protein
MNTREKQPGLEKHRCTTAARKILACVLAGFLCAVATARDLRRASPHVVAYRATVLPKGNFPANTLLRATVAPDEKLPSTFTIQADQQKITFHDDGSFADATAGDHVYTALGNLDYALLRANQERVLKALPIQGDFIPVPLWHQRAQLKDAFAPIINFDRLRPWVTIPLWPIPVDIVSVDPDKSLVIRDPLVVEDVGRTYNPCTGVGRRMGKWTFGYLVQQMCNEPVTGLNPSEFARRWIQTWATDQSINGWTVPARSAMADLLHQWEDASGGPGAALDLAEAPFKLVAIVNRLDLRDNLLFGPGDAGEARFVFAPVSRTGGCHVLDFTVIFEYGVSKASCEDLRAYAIRWLGLSRLPFGEDYRVGLERITDQFTAANAAPSKPNGSALNQLRTSDNAFHPFMWEFREFRLSAEGGDAGYLRQVTVKQTPDLSLTGAGVIRDYINAFAPEILGARHEVPLEFPPGSPFRGGASLMPPGFLWNASGISSAGARHLFSLQTCNACHAGETRSSGFHIRPTPFGAPATLSVFMTGVDVIDVLDHTIVRRFDELRRRAADLDMLVHSECLVLLPIMSDSFEH